MAWIFSTISFAQNQSSTESTCPSSERSCTTLWPSFFYTAKSASSSESSSQVLPVGLGGISLSGQWFLAYVTKETKDKSASDFELKRGYITLHRTFSKTLSARITQDIAIDRKGDGKGDIEIRLKYGYLRYTFNDFAFLSNSSIEFGLVHRTWIDFEESFNNYRIQGTMFLERVGILRSADYGITFISTLGKELDSEYQYTINHKYPGRYGSIAVGLYNGGGYDAIEQNNNKLIEGRLAIRPLPDFLPGLQISWVGAYGKGNTAAAPVFSFNAGFLSFEHQHFILTCTYFQSLGNLRGTAINNLGHSVRQNGYSYFGEVKILSNHIGIFARLDHFNSETTTLDYFSKRYIAGIACLFLNGSKVVLDCDYANNHKWARNGLVVVELAIEFNF